MARTQLKKAATAAKKYYDRSAHLNKYRTGDAVKVRVTRRFKGMKFVDKYEGPFYIIDQLGETTFRVAKSANTRERVIHHDLILPYFPSVDEEAANIDWVFEKARELAEGRVSQTGSQTELSVPPKGDGDAVPALNRTLLRDHTITVLEQPDEALRVGEEGDGEIKALISRATQTNIYLDTKMLPKDLKNVYMQLVCLRASNRSISAIGTNSKRYYHVEDYFDTAVDTKYGASPRAVQWSQQVEANSAKIEGDVYNTVANRHKPPPGRTMPRGMNTRITLGAIMSSMNLMTQQAAMKGFQMIKTQRGAELVDGRAQHQLVSRSMQTMLELPPAVSHDDWALMFEQALLASIIRDANWSTYPMVISPDQDPDDFGEARVRDDDKTVEEYIDMKWSHQPAYVAHDQCERANVSVQTDIVLSTEHNDGPENVIYEQARIAGFEIGARGAWQRPARTFLDDIQLCQEPKEEEEKKSVTPTRELETLLWQPKKRVKVTVPAAGAKLDIKPRKRGRPRKAPQKNCAEAAMQTDI